MPSFPKLAAIWLSFKLAAVTTLILLLNKGRGKPAAEAWLDFLKSDKAKAIIRGFGYEI